MSKKVSHVRPFLKYSMLPGLFPRLYDLVASGFSYFAFLMASIYNIVRLIPAGHPYLNSANIGRFGVRHVVAEASKNLVFKRENLDQIILYFILLAALILIAGQFVFLMLAIVSPAAMATPFAVYFGTNALSDPNQDIAFMLLDRVFGVPNIFNSCVTTATPCYGLTPQLTFDTVNVMAVPPAPWPFHLALHSMFQFYSTGLLIIGMLLIVYYAIAITAETAQTGTPFGKRFNTVWAPIRLVVAIGLLVPLGSGLNSSQYIVLYAAKLGSNMATNGWLTFNVNLAGAISGGGLINSANMIATPNGPDAKRLVTFMILAKTCAIIEDAALQQEGGTHPSGTQNSLPNNQRNAIHPWLVKAVGTPNREPFANSHATLGSSAVAPGGGGGGIPGTTPITSYAQARTFYQNGDILIRFGELNPARYGMEKGGVSPYCGELVLKNSSLYEPGALEIQRRYYEMIAAMWDDPAMRDLGLHYARLRLGNIPQQITSSAWLHSGAWPPTPAAPPPALNVDFTNLGEKYLYAGGFPPAAPGAGSINEIIATAVLTQQTSTDFNLPGQLLARGWGGAGIWYNRIAQMNGAMVGASRNLPDVKAYPATMTYAAMQHEMLDESFSNVVNSFSPSIKQKIIPFKRKNEETAAQVYHDVFKAANIAESTATDKPTGNPFTDIINLMFGTEGLMNLRSPANQNIHPLAQIAGVGKSLIESAILNLGIGALGAGACAAGEDVGCTGMSAAFGIAGMGLTIGFILFYVIPFLPFVYFFFAVGNWVKGIFEAMVGAPLWALGHLRIDGDGLPGEGAMNGYYLIFEIFLRPILIVFGLLASILIFAAMASVLNNIWDLVTVNATGFNSLDPAASGGGTVANAISWSRGKIDQFFFLIIYAVILYMMALSSFKLIDMIPNSILRWMGSSVTSFGDNSEDAAQSLTQYAAIGGGMIFQQGLGGLEGGVKGIKGSQDAAAGQAAQKAQSAKIDAALAK